MQSLRRQVNTIAHYERFSKRTTRKEGREFLSDSIGSKIRRDFVASRPEQTVETTARIPDLDDSLDLPEGSDGAPILVRKYLDFSKFVSLLQDGIWFSRLDNFDNDLLLQETS